MPQQVFGAEAAVSMVNRALANTSPAHTVYLNQVAAAGTTAASQYAFAQQLGAQYAVGKTAAELSAQVLANVGVSNDILKAALTDYIAFHGVANIGIIALQLGQLLSGLEGDATFGAAAKAWNQEVTNAYQYSSSSNNNTPQTGDDGAGTTKLSRFTDVLTAHEFTGYLDYNQFTGRDEQTLTTGDRLTGTDAADDVLFAQLTDGARPTLNGIEIVSIDAKGNAPVLDLSDANGVKTIINANSNENSTLTFSNLKNLVDVAIKGTNGNTVVGFNGSVVAGTTDALNLTVDGVGVKAKAANVTVEGIETLNITASGKASVLGTVASGNVKSLVITGDQDLTVGTKASVANAQAAVDAAKNDLALAKADVVTKTTALTTANTGLTNANTTLANAVAAKNAAQALVDNKAPSASTAVATAATNAADAAAAKTAVANTTLLATQLGLATSNQLVTDLATAITTAVAAQANQADVAAAAQTALINFLAGKVLTAQGDVTTAQNGVTTAQNGVTTAQSNLNAANTDVTAKTTAVTDAEKALTNAQNGAQGFTSANIETVDASAATGNLFLNLVASADRDQSVKTGTGNDVVVTGKLSAADTFDLGAGNDRLVLTTVNSNEAAKLIGVEEVEARQANTNLNLTNAADVKLLAVAENAGFASVTAVKSGSSVVFEGSGLKNAVSNSTAAFGGVTYNLANANGASDVIDFKFNNGGVVLGAKSNVNIGQLVNTGNNTETLNFTFSDLVASNTVTVAGITGNAGALKTLNVASDSKVVFNGVNTLTSLTSVDATAVKNGFVADFGALASTAAATIKLGGAGANVVSATSAANLGGSADSTATLLTVDGSAGTGAQKLTVTNLDTSTTSAPANAYANRTDVVTALNTGGKVGANVLGGSGNDEITVNTSQGAISTIKGGAGADKIVLQGATGTDVLVLALGDAGSSVATGDVVTGFVANGAGQDFLDLRSFGFDLALQQVGTLNAATGAFEANKAVGTYAVGTDLVVAIDANGDGKLNDGDLVVTLVGVNGGQFDANDIIWNS